MKGSLNMPCGIPISPLLILAPIGSVVAWLKSYANTPALPSGWVECNGQTLSDVDSVFTGQAIPNLNGANRFLRGNSTSGGTGGAATVQLTIAQMPSHSHDIHTVEYPGTSGDSTNIFTKNNTPENEIVTSIPEGGGDNNWGEAHENLPPYYNVVWIMRVK
jgi:microcystin-dependent protein